MSLERREQDANGDLMYRFNRPWSDGTTGIKLSPLELLEKLAALVPLPRAPLVRYAGCLAPHSKLRAAIIPTPRQQGVDGDASKTGTPYWHWARLLGRVFDLDMAPVFRHCVGGGKRVDALRRRSRARPCDLPLCRRGALRIIAAILPPLCGRREPCDLHPRVGDHAHPASPQAGLRATSHCPGPLSPRTLRVRRSPRQREPIGDVRVTAAYFAPSWRETPFEIVPQLCPASCILGRLSRPRIAAPRLAQSTAACGRRCWGSRQRCAPAAAAGEGRRWQRQGEQVALSFLSSLTWSAQVALGSRAPANAYNCVSRRWRVAQLRRRLALEPAGRLCGHEQAPPGVVTPAARERL
jgi:hypothetical protein